jgi:hypothetical protein
MSCLVRVAHDKVSVARDLARVVGRDAAGTELVDGNLGHEQFGHRVRHAPKRPVNVERNRASDTTIPGIGAILSA